MSNGSLFGVLMSSTNCYAFVGELQERYGAIRVRRGRIPAAFWFWRQVFPHVIAGPQSKIGSAPT
jgi:hypothetical protein